MFDYNIKEEDIHVVVDSASVPGLSEYIIPIIESMESDMERFNPFALFSLFAKSSMVRKKRIYKIPQ